MKITIATPWFPHPHRGIAHGAERYVENLALYLKKLGHEIKIVTTFYNGTKKYDNYKGMPILRILDSKAILGKYGAAFFINYMTFGLNLIRRKNFKFYKDSDFIITNIVLGFTNYFKLKKIPVISVFFHYDKTFNDLIFDILFIYMLHYLEKRQFRKHNHIIAISEASKNDLIKYYKINKDKILVIPIGVELERFKPSNYSEEIRKKYGKNILFYSALTVKRKRLPVLLKAMPLIKKEIPDVHLVLSGGGPQWENCKLIAKKLDILSYTTFLGFIKEEDLLKYYATSDLYILPSEREGFGQVIFEAMASGTPVICADIPPMSELIENGGRTFKLNDHEDLAKQVIYLLKNREELKKLSENAIRIAQKYDWNNIIKIYDKYLKIVKKKGRY
ncbi:MAG: glycosyltransferase family 4 protein [Promethearchaeota archaeon]